MQEIRGLLDRFTHHHKLTIAVNDNCKIALPAALIRKFQSPHKLSYYYFVFVYQGSSSYQVDLKDATIADGQVLFGLPTHVFANYPKNKDEKFF